MFAVNIGKNTREREKRKQRKEQLNDEREWHALHILEPSISQKEKKSYCWNAIVIKFSVSSAQKGVDFLRILFVAVINGKLNYQL